MRFMRRVSRPPAIRPGSKRFSGLRRLTFVAVAALLVAISFLGLGYYAAEEGFLGRVTLELNNIGDLPLPTSADRILVLAPHPDDEVLGTGGLIQQALAVGADVRVVFLTFGDNNILSFQSFLKRPVLTPTQIRAMGETRRLEALSALDVLGVAREQVTFLGYPDNGAMRLWRTHWSGAEPLWSRWLNSNQVPYQEAFSPGAAYSSANVLADLTQILAGFQPTMIFTSHPDDANSDHQALWLFTQAALFDLGAPYDAIPVWCYLVHYGSWPQARNVQTGNYLLPPTALLRADMAWTKFLLDDAQLVTKTAALSKHASQLSLRPAYLESFLRANDLFARVDPVQLSAPLFEWQGIEFRPLFGSPKASLLKHLAPGLLLDEFDLAAQDDDLQISVATRRPLSPRQILVVWLFPHSAGTPFAETPKLEIILNSRGLSRVESLSPDMRDAIRFERADGRMVLRVSRAALGDPDALFVSASMHSNGIVLDRAGWRLVQLAPDPLRPIEPDPQPGVLHARWEQDADPAADEALPAP